MRGRIFYFVVGLQLLALVCIAVAYTKRNDVVVEGTYFNRVTGKAVESGTWPAGTTAPWLVAAAVFALAALTGFVVDRRRRSSR